MEQTLSFDVEDDIDGDEEVVEEVVGKFLKNILARYMHEEGATLVEQRWCK